MTASLRETSSTALCAGLPMTTVATSEKVANAMPDILGAAPAVSSAIGRWLISAPMQKVIAMRAQNTGTSRRHISAEGRVLSARWPSVASTDAPGTRTQNTTAATSMSVPLVANTAPKSQISLMYAATGGPMTADTAMSAPVIPIERV